MEKKGFFKPEKRRLVMTMSLFIGGLVMYIPAIYHAQTSGGTAVQFIWASVILMLAPTLSLIDTLISK